MYEQLCMEQLPEEVLSIIVHGVFCLNPLRLRILAQVSREFYTLTNSIANTKLSDLVGHKQSHVKKNAVRELLRFYYLREKREQILPIIGHHSDVSTFFCRNNGIGFTIGTVVADFDIDNNNLKSSCLICCTGDENENNGNTCIHDFVCCCIDDTGNIIYAYDCKHVAMYKINIETKNIVQLWIRFLGTEDGSVHHYRWSYLSPITIRYIPASSVAQNNSVLAISSMAMSNDIILADLNNSRGPTMQTSLLSGIIDSGKMGTIGIVGTVMDYDIGVVTGHRMLYILGASSKRIEIHNIDNKNDAIATIDAPGLNPFITFCVDRGHHRVIAINRTLCLSVHAVSARPICTFQHSLGLTKAVSFALKNDRFYVQVDKKKRVVVLHAGLRQVISVIVLN